MRPIVYIDALMSQMAAPEREALTAAIDALAEPASGGPEALKAVALTPPFLQVRALAIEAFYSDFVAPGRDGPGAWAEIGFDPPVARRLRKDWSYLGVA